jgi:putative Mg2+ transporter-C (MgtC) family protein
MELFANSIAAPYLQLLLAIVCGMILGIERVLAGRTAGPRTYGLVSLGACLLTVLSTHVASIYPDMRNIDPVHMLAAIISGIGFIGAGLIIFKDSKLSGITTAAGIWVAAGIGIAIGFKEYLLSIYVTFLTLFLFTVMWHFENKIKHYFSYHKPEEDDN